MLTNILHTIALTIGLGARATTNFNVQQKPQISRDTTNWSMGLTETTTTYALSDEFITTDAENFLVSQYNVQDYNYYDSNITLRSRRIVQNTYIRDDTTLTKSLVSENKTVRATNYYVNYTYQNVEYQRGTAQEIIFLEITTANPQKSISLGIDDIIDMPTIANTTKNAYVEIISTTTNLENYLNYTIGNLQTQHIQAINYYTVNNNLYDLVSRIKLEEIGYTSNVETHTYNYINEQLEYVNPMIYQNRKTNYYVMYIQPQYTKINNNSYEEVNEGIYNSIDNYSVSDLTFDIRGVNVITTGSTEVVDVPGVMFTVLGMPFTFISIAFNLTIFPGTPYEVNLSMLFLAIIGVLIFVWLLKLVISKVS